MNSKNGISLKMTYGKKILLASAAAVFLGAAAMGTSLAFLIDQTDQITNQFSGSEITGEIEEKFDGYEKKDVKITNTGDADAYVRAVLVPNWVDDQGKVYGEVPKPGTDYTMTLADDGGWKEGSDGFYYCTQKIGPGESTPVLVELCRPESLTKTAPDGTPLHFELQVVASLIQASPAEAVKNAWGTEAAGLVGAASNTGSGAAGAE